MIKYITTMIWFLIGVCVILPAAYIVWNVFVSWKHGYMSWKELYHDYMNI